MGRLRSRWCGGRTKRASRSLTNEGRGTCSTSSCARFPEAETAIRRVDLAARSATTLAVSPRLRIHRSRKEDGPTDDLSSPEIAEHLGGVLERSPARHDGTEASRLREGDHPGEIGHRRGVRTDV